MSAICFVSRDMLNLRPSGRYAVELNNPLEQDYEGIGVRGEVLNGPDHTPILGKVVLSIDSFGTVQVRALNAIGNDEEFEKNGNLLIRKFGNASFIVPVA